MIYSPIENENGDEDPRDEDDWNSCEKKDLHIAGDITTSRCCGAYFPFAVIRDAIGVAGRLRVRQLSPSPISQWDCNVAMQSNTVMQAHANDYQLMRRRQY